VAAPYTSNKERSRTPKPAREKVPRRPHSTKVCPRRPQQNTKHYTSISKEGRTINQPETQTKEAAPKLSKRNQGGRNKSQQEKTELRRPYHYTNISKEGRTINQPEQGSRSKKLSPRLSLEEEEVDHLFN
jgi:hypothetical protein